MPRSKSYAPVFSVASHLETIAGSRAAPFDSASKAQPDRGDDLEETFPLYAIFRSIDSQSDATVRDKAIRWESLIANYRAWKPHLDVPKVLIVRFEDLITAPQPTMTAVYSHLGLPDSTRFLEPFARQFPKRFLWNTAVNGDTGAKGEFDSRRIREWDQHLSEEQLQRLYSDPLVVEFMERFGYER